MGNAFEPPVPPSNPRGSTHSTSVLTPGHSGSGTTCRLPQDVERIEPHRRASELRLQQLLTLLDEAEISQRIESVELTATVKLHLLRISILDQDPLIPRLVLQVRFRPVLYGRIRTEL